MTGSTKGLLFVVAFGVAIQAVPYGRDHENPPVTGQPQWDKPATRELFYRVCKNCHSNETTWPWYSGIAPISWLVQHDVDEGRSHFDVSEWGRKKNHGDEAASMVRKQEMPPWLYLPAHPEAFLSQAERKELIAGLVATFGDEDAEGGHGHGHDEGS